jgi:hypothetical protein
MRGKSGFGWTLLMLFPIAALLVGCTGAQDSSSNEMRAVVHADMNEVMSDVDAAMKSDPAVGMSSHPYDYVGISPAFERLVGRGEPALEAIASEIEASEENGLREYLLAIAGQRILGGDEPNQAWATGKEWAALYRSQH